MADIVGRLPTVAVVRQRLAGMGWEASDEFLGALLADERSGISSLGRRVLARREKIRVEVDRLDRMLVFEKRCWARGEPAVAGVDEAGRGPLAGPVVASAVILAPEAYLPGVDDSKRLTPSKREGLFSKIFGEAEAVGTGVVWQDVIDRDNIRQATFRAMRKAVDKLGCSPDFVLVDGERISGLSLRQAGIPKGDQRSLSIAAASIVAKVVRDRIMGVLDRKYPGYGFARHKGYGTEAHRRAIAERGLCPLHRRTFCKC